MSTQSSCLGIDAGATLCKLAKLEAGRITTREIAAWDLDGARRAIDELGAQRMVATGGGAERWQRELGPTLSVVGEFDAWARGAPWLAADEGIALPDRYLLVSLGTGTSILLIGNGEATRVGGSALGGGTLLGLGQLLTGVESFEELVELAARGDRRRVDLLVGDIYSHSDLPLPRDLNASSFAKLRSRAPADLAHALVGLIGENIGLISGHLATLHGVELALYCGSTLKGNRSLRAVVSDLGRMTGCRTEFLARGAFCGAVGAALSPI